VPATGYQSNAEGSGKKRLLSPACVLMTGTVVGIFLTGTMMFGANIVHGQTYPDRAIRIITGPPGSDNDIAARTIAQGISGPLDQPVIVDNRASTGVVPIEAVAKARPDGYTVLVIGSSLWTIPLIQKTSYDPVKDFLPVSLLTSTPSVLVVHPSLPVKSVKELIALAKAKAGALNYSSGVAGGFSHLAAELFKSLAGVNIVQIAYKGSAQSVIAVLGGEVELTFGSVVPVAPNVKSGKLRALGITSAEPSALLPGLPTIAAAGVPGYEAVVSNGLLAPAGTPAAIVNRLNQATVRLLKSTETKEMFLRSGVEAVGSSPEQFALAIKAEMARLGKVIKGSGLKIE